MEKNLLTLLQTNFRLFDFHVNNKLGCGEWGKAKTYKGSQNQKMRHMSTQDNSVCRGEPG